jgi:uncharacterized protein (TIGR03546 family)
MFWLQILSNFIKILRQGQTPHQVAGGFALGSIVGLSPSMTLQGLCVWLIIFVFEVNLSAAFLGFTLFAFIAYILDPLFHQLGYVLLVQIDSLQEFWTMLYNAPLAPLTRFNNTLVLGSLVAAVVFLPAVYFGMKRFVVAYRTHLLSKIEKWKVSRVISKSSVVRWYQKLRDLKG